MALFQRRVFLRYRTRYPEWLLRLRPNQQKALRWSCPLEYLPSLPINQQSRVVYNILSSLYLKQDSYYQYFMGVVLPATYNGCQGCPSFVFLRQYAPGYILLISSARDRACLKPPQQNTIISHSRAITPNQ